GPLLARALGAPRGSNTQGFYGQVLNPSYRPGPIPTSVQPQQISRPPQHASRNNMQPVPFNHAANMRESQMMASGDRQSHLIRNGLSDQRLTHGHHHEANPRAIPQQLMPPASSFYPCSYTQRATPQMQVS